jgi:hypothetical protein
MAWRGSICAGFPDRRTNFAFVFPSSRPATRTRSSWRLNRNAKQQHSVIPKGITAPDLADMVMRGEVKLSPQQMRAMIELLPFHAPKLTAVALSSMTAQDFASRLERALQRSDAVRFPKLIEHR